MDRTLQSGEQRSRVVGENFSPLFSLTGSTRQGIQLSIVMDRSSTITDQQVGSQTKSTTQQIRVSSNYSFSSPNGIPLPLLRGLRLKSRMSVNLSVSHKITKSFQDPTGQSNFEDPTQNNADFTVSVRSNYSFSTRVRGGMNLEWTDRSTNNVGSGRQKTHSRSVAIWAEFTF
jgi:hypothetical protein